MPDTTPSPFSLWLEEALTGWILPVAALGLAGASWGLYALGLLPDGLTGAALALVFSAAMALLMVRAALAPAVDRPTRVATVTLAVAAAGLCLVGALGAVLPGAPLAEGELAGTGAVLPLPPSLSGRVRLLVHAPLPPGGTPEVEFRLSGGAEPMSGHVERTVSQGRAGRSRTNVTHDHNEVYVHGAVAPGATLTLDRLSGQVAGPLHVAVVGATLPPAALWLLSLVIAAGAALVDARIRKGNVGALAGMAVAYGLLVGLNATPATAVGTSLGAILLGGLAGALGGGLLAMLARLTPFGARGSPAPAATSTGAGREAGAGGGRRGTLA